MKGGKLKSEGSIFKSTLGAGLRLAPRPAGVKGPALDAVVNMAGTLAVIKIVVPAVVIDPDCGKEKQSNYQEACYKYPKSDGYHCRKQQRRPPVGDASLLKRLFQKTELLLFFSFFGSVIG